MGIVLSLVAVHTGRLIGLFDLVNHNDKPPPQWRRRLVGMPVPPLLPCHRVLIANGCCCLPEATAMGRVQSAGDRNRHLTSI
jgi:hypothetical protein